MTRNFTPTRATGMLLIAGFLCGGIVPRAEAGKWFQRRGRSVVTTTVTAPAVAPAPAPVAYVPAQPQPTTLGTFAPTPYIMVAGNFPGGSGYSPIGLYGDTTLALYGPLSALREVTAPISLYTRGYDGRTVQVEAMATSFPNLPALSPIIYPTQATNAFGFRQTTTPPWWTSGSNWIDQN